LSSTSSARQDVQESYLESRSFEEDARGEIPFVHSSRELLQHVIGAQEAVLAPKANYDVESSVRADRRAVPVSASRSKDHLNRMNDVSLPESGGGSGFMNSIQDLMTSNNRGYLTQTGTGVPSMHGNVLARIPVVSSVAHPALSVPEDDSLIGDMVQTSASQTGHGDHETETEQHMVQSLFYGHGMGDGGQNADDDIGGDADFGF
jgi:hypothetical protein